MEPGEADQGVTGDRYTVVPRVVCFLRRGDEVLLLKGAPDKRLWAGLYNGIGGHMERDEHPYQTARREILEEAGLEVTDLRLGGIVHVALSSGPGVLVFVFTGEAPAGDVRPSREGTLEWMRAECVPGLPVVEDLPVLLRRLLNAAPGSPPFFARSYYDRRGQMHVEFADGKT